jgi:hypothetical protein
MELPNRMHRIAASAGDRLDMSGANWLALTIAAWFALLAVAGLTLLAVGLLGSNSNSTLTFLGALLAIGGVGSLTLMAPYGAARFGRRVVASWFRGMTAAAFGVALAFLDGYASLPTDQTAKANSDMTASVASALIAVASAWLLLRLRVQREPARPQAEIPSAAARS